jgi:hypothetical protein
LNSPSIDGLINLYIVNTILLEKKLI